VVADADDLILPCEVVVKHGIGDNSLCVIGLAVDFKRNSVALSMVREIDSASLPVPSKERTLRYDVLYVLAK
jgi:hypothetical protein